MRTQPDDDDDDARRQELLLTKLTLLQVRTELLRRRVGRHPGLGDADWVWLDDSLAAILHTARELAPLITDVGVASPAWMREARAVPTTRHMAAGDIHPT
jgi:hypothetical protein